VPSSKFGSSPRGLV